MLFCIYRRWNYSRDELSQSDNETDEKYVFFGRQETSRADNSMYEPSSPYATAAAPEAGSDSRSPSHDFQRVMMDTGEKLSSEFSFM